jgi:Flp pilus assembly protein TadG
MRRDRLLRPNENGSAPIEAVFSIVLLLVLVFGLIQVAFVLYGRNVVMSSAHEGARSAVELGSDTADAAIAAENTVRSAAGRLVEDLDVDVAVTHNGARAIVTVSVSGSLDAFGPVPVAVPVSVSATSVRDETLR